MHLCFHIFHMGALIIQAGDAFPHMYHSPTSNEIKKTAPSERFSPRDNCQHLLSKPHTASPIHDCQNGHTSHVCHGLGKCKNGTEPSKRSSASDSEGRRDHYDKIAVLGRAEPLQPYSFTLDIHYLATVNISVTQLISLQRDQ